tara:strand:+ start:3364 stop:3660 length:297 start_codon:yes stop_codon:yes gene_type:complete
MTLDKGAFSRCQVSVLNVLKPAVGFRAVNLTLWQVVVLHKEFLADSIDQVIVVLSRKDGCISIINKLSRPEQVPKGQQVVLVLPWIQPEALIHPFVLW